MKFNPSLLRKYKHLDCQSSKEETSRFLFLGMPLTSSWRKGT